MCYEMKITRLRISLSAFPHKAHLWILTLTALAYHSRIFFSTERNKEKKNVFLLNRFDSMSCEYELRQMPKLTTCFSNKMQNDKSVFFAFHFSRTEVRDHAKDKCHQYLPPSCHCMCHFISIHFFLQ